MIIKRIYHIVRSRIEILPFIFVKFNFKLIGVTGTDGKTTTSTLIYNMLRNDGKKVALITTLGAFVDGKKLTDTGLHITTPSAFTLHKILTKVKNYDFVVLETSSHAIDQRRIVGLLYDTIVYTNITHEHLDYHKTWERYASTKLSLQKYLRKQGYVILNVDDKKSFDFLYPKIKKDFNIFTYGIYNEADFRAVNIAKNLFDIKSKYLSLSVVSDLIGEYNISNSLAAIAALYSFDISIKSILKTLEHFPSIDGRFDIISKDPFVIVDFAHTPNAIKNILDTIDRMKTNQSRVITVFGAPGRRDHTKRPLMGKSASDYSDIIIITSDDPRDENLENIFSDISKGIDRKKFRKDINFFRIDDRYEAIKKALNLYRKDDIIALLGKGHEKSNAILGKEIPWSDKDKTLKLIKKRKS
ncbi:UDP-N-acetylmuramoyl-L-alanyl-D-glutamate--2,6-diaminopimelate ligase [Patescibacteria group bacterium]|nr:UDP-N-acetylmuramoyl-L-alanyl-D-glutamate--2,6-diaminopimelate ligase [Patescibacteria group bacterium]